MKYLVYIFCLLSTAWSAKAETRVGCNSSVSRLQVIESGPDEAPSKFVIAVDRLVVSDDPKDKGTWVTGIHFAADQCLVHKGLKADKDIALVQCTVNVDSKPVRSYSLIKQQDGTFNFVDTYNPRENNLTGLLCQ